MSDGITLLIQECKKGFSVKIGNNLPEYVTDEKELLCFIATIVNIPIWLELPSPKVQISLEDAKKIIADSAIKGRSFRYILVSRRSCFRAGTRYNIRGIDAEGHVANFVETEQIVEYGTARCSFVQVMTN